MRSSVVVLGVAAATATAGLVWASTSSGSPSGHRSGPRSATTISVVEHADTDTTADIAPTGDSLGDVLAFHNPVFNAANTKRVGTDNGSCIRTAVGAAYECSWTTSLYGGAITVQGPFYDTHDSVLAVTGGTGRFLGASGKMRLHARNAQGTAYNFVFVLERHRG